MGYLRGFAPWIVFSVVSMVGWQWGALAALVATLVSIVLNRRAGARLDAQILDLGGLVYFAALTGIAFIDPTSPLQAIGSPLASAWLATIALFSLVIGRPFTLGIARRRVTAEVAANPKFLRVNLVISSFWTAGFAFQAIVGFTVTGSLADVARQVIGLAVPLLLTRQYMARIRARQAAAAPTKVLVAA
jgi:hypothetical protein